MNAQSEIDRITQNVADTYSALEEKGATMPEEQNSDNLAATARSVPAGGTTGVSVQSDWDQMDETAADFIKNKPFGEALSDSVTFNGDLSGVNAIGFFFKVSDSVPTYADVTKGGAYTVTGETVEYTAAEAPEIVYEFSDGIILIAEIIFIVPPEMAGVTSEEIGLAFPEAGVYFAYSEKDGVLVTELRLDDYTGFVTTKKLDTKFINPQMSVFYVSFSTYVTDPYIYSDRFCTTKATFADVDKAINTGPIALFNVLAEANVLVQAWYDFAITSEGGYWEIAKDNLRLHTAEYTPPTT